MLSSRRRSSKYVYKKRSEDDIKAQAEQTSGRYDGFYRNGITKYKPVDGENVIRFLPPTWPKHKHFGYEIWVHRFINRRGDFLCPAKMKNKPCAICEAAQETREEGNEDEARKMEADKRYVYWILDRNQSTKKQEPLIYDMSFSLDRDMAQLYRKSRRTGGVLYVDHPDDGYDVFFNKSGQMLKTRYTGLSVDRDSSPIADSPEKQDKILEFIQENPVPDQLVFKTNAYLKQVVEGMAEERDEDEEERPRRKSRGRDRDEEDEDDDDRPRRSKSRRDEDDDEEDEDEDRKSLRRSSRDEDDDEDEEEERPAKKSKRSRDDDDDTEEEDDDEDERPRRGKQRASRDEDEEEEDEDDTRGKRRSARKADEDEDEEDETEEDDDEEVKPRKRTRLNRR